MRTETSGNDGVSGEISVETGASAVGDSGGITLATGSAMTGAGGDVNLLVGSGDTENGGAVVIKSWREPRRLEEGRRCVHHIWRRHERPGRLWRRARHDGGQR